MAETDEAGWKSDPTRRHELRYWNGSAWSEHISDRGVTGSDPLPPAPPQPGGRPTGVAPQPGGLPARAAPAPPPRQVAPHQAGQSGMLLEVMSHEEGRNSKVRVFADRVEREKAKARTSLSRARQDAEVIPLRSISSVQAKKDGMTYTKVTVYATGNTIEFRLRHQEAQLLKDAITRLLLAPTQTAAPPHMAPAAAPPTKGDRLREIAQLRDEGLLSPEEFEAEKAKILAG